MHVMYLPKKSNMASSNNSTDSEAASNMSEKECDSPSKIPVECFMHFQTGKGKVQLFTKQSWSRFLQYTDAWRAITKGPQPIFGRNFIARMPAYMPAYMPASSADGSHATGSGPSTPSSSEAVTSQLLDIPFPKCWSSSVRNIAVRSRIFYS